MPDPSKNPSDSRVTTSATPSESTVSGVCERCRCPVSGLIGAERPVSFWLLWLSPVRLGNAALPRGESAGWPPASTPVGVGGCPDRLRLSVVGGRRWMGSVGGWPLAKLAQ